MLSTQGAARQWLTAGLEENATHLLVDVDNAERLVAAVKADKKWRTALVQNARGVAELFVCPRCLRQHYVSVIVALRERFYELDRTMNSHLRDARTTPAQRAYDAFTKEREAEHAYHRFQEKSVSASRRRAVRANTHPSQTQVPEAEGEGLA